MSALPFCDTRRESHFDICTTLKISTANYIEEDDAEHAGFELCYTLNDSHYYRKIRNQSWHVVPGQLMAINGLEKHREECAKTPTVPEIRSVIIEPRFLARLFEEVDLDPDQLLFDDLVTPMTPHMRRLLDILFSLKATPGISRLAYDCLITELVVELVQTMKNTHSDRLKTLTRTGYFPESFAKAKQTIREFLSSENTDLESIARAVGLSKYHFIRGFKRNTGLSPIQYMNQVRVDFVKEKLASTDVSITQIAHQLGYSDISTFNKTFKKYTGVSPSQYRTIRK